MAAAGLGRQATTAALSQGTKQRQMVSQVQQQLWTSKQAGWGGPHLDANEAGVGQRVCRFYIRVVLLHQLAVRLLDFLLAGIVRHTQGGPGVVQAAADLHREGSTRCCRRWVVSGGGGAGRGKLGPCPDPALCCDWAHGLVAT